ncbi:MAG: 23S rRNA (uracil(1939)-C(5))-methyltransferase RlmD [Zoogloeaceae bacterium]|jgi:23S rRNA (uracil1939-C5)-methyltransferase|nr:23S rRNA (uracil(1939)-C(5))-methyltransferase RlmD [Zoogloeaceae bacterium]
MPIAPVSALDLEGRGIVRVEDSKTVFVEGALPFETVEYEVFREKSRYEQARLVRVLAESPFRTTPGCPHFGVCGGCAMQHLSPEAQLAAKARALEDAFAHIGRIRPESILPPSSGHPWGYRHKARLSVRLVEKKGGVLVGFHEKKSRYVADMRTCPVLHPTLSALLMPLRALVGGLSIRARLPQIEAAVGEEGIALVLRILEPLTEADETALKTFADAHGVIFYLQAKGPETARRFYPEGSPYLHYRLPEFGVTMPFAPTDFTQVNHAMNRILLRRALRLLDPRPGEKIADLFCGLGNFSLPIARSGADVLGIEGNAALVARARENAKANGIAPIRFMAANLFEGLPTTERFDKLLVDPPREGAIEALKALPLDALPGRIVYVSCNPATLARDAAYLVGVAGYRLTAAGIVNMFPHTAHVESIAVFNLPENALP